MNTRWHLQFGAAFPAHSNRDCGEVRLSVAERSVWKRKVHAACMGFGVIIDGNPREPGDEQWVAHALERSRALLGNQAFRPDDFIFQSWMPRPTKLLPETARGTLMNLVAQAGAIR
jgi:hypothetical protein